MPRNTLKHADERAGTVLRSDYLDFLLHEHATRTLPRLELLWDYYRNDLDETRSGGAQRYQLAQRRGLPARLNGETIGNDSRISRRREVVIENDIAWRIHALVDFMFGKPIALQSLAPNIHRAHAIETFLHQVFEANGGVRFFQDLALLGSVYGHVDVLLRTDDVRPIDKKLRDTLHHHIHHPEPLHGSAADNHHAEPAGAHTTMSLPTHRSDASESGGGAFSSFDALGRELMNRAGAFMLETIEAPRAIPVLNPSDYRQLDAYVLHFRQHLNEVDQSGFADRLRERVMGRALNANRRAMVECTETWTAGDARQMRGSADKRRTVDARANRLGRVPVVHIQNLPLPFFYEGLSEVEPLIPLQDELNTRLSDRANRVTFQCFKMYLGKGIEGFLDRPVGPGQMWSTDNTDAVIDEFGGDGSCPSEDAHINEIREAMDKTSGVTPLAAGVIRDRVGNLTSENALRVTMMGMLSKTEKKRVTYGQGIERICELVLHAADVLGVLPNTVEERRVRIDWPSPMPESESQRLADAKLKLELGVPRKQVLMELGYG